MKVQNQRNKNILAKNIRIANNPLTRFIGLLNKSALQEGEGLLITPCKGIHSCFMRFKFDAIFIDKNNCVKHLIKEMKPWKFSEIYKKVNSVIELPAGTLDETDTKLNDILVFMKE